MKPCRKYLKPTLVSLLIVSMALACQRPESPTIELTDGQKEQIEPYLLDEIPDPEHQLGVEFDEQVELVGVDIDGRVAPGADVEMTWYWRALEDVDEDWQIFVHFDSEDVRFRQNLDHFPLGRQLDENFRLYHWEEGDIVADVQRFTVREDYPEGEAIFYVGLFQGEQRAEVSNDGPATDHNRAIGPSFDIGSEPRLPLREDLMEAADSPVYEVSRLDEEEHLPDAELDGRFEASFWGSIPPMHLESFGGPGAQRSSILQLAYTEDALLIGGRFADDAIYAGHDEASAQLWADDAFQVLIAPDDADGAYVELLFNVSGQLYTAAFDEPPGEDERPSVADGSIRRTDPNRSQQWAPENVDVSIYVDGEPDAIDSNDEGWSFLLEVPFEDFPFDVDAPREGDSWRAGMFRFDFVNDSLHSTYGWVPSTRIDHHRVDQFGTLEFTGELETGPQVRRIQSSDLSSVTDSPSPAFTPAGE